MTMMMLMMTLVFCLSIEFYMNPIHQGSEKSTNVWIIFLSETRPLFIIIIIYKEKTM